MTRTLRSMAAIGMTILPTIPAAAQAPEERAEVVAAAVGHLRAKMTADGSIRAFQLSIECRCAAEFFRTHNPGIGSLGDRSPYGERSEQCAAAGHFGACRIEPRPSWWTMGCR